MIWAKFGGGWFGDRVFRDDFALPIDEAGEVVDFRFRYIRDDGKTAAHVAIQRAVADGEFAFVARG